MKLLPKHADNMNRPLLTVDLVPKTCWCHNVRSEVSPAQWDILRKQCYRNADYKCEICGGTGPDWPVECHEVWEYNDKSRTQILRRLIALCPSCHQVKHIGLAGIQGNYDIAVDHIMSVNNWNRHEAEMHINEAFDTWRLRNEHNWTLDIAWLKYI